MPFSQEELHELPHVISEPRFGTYLQASGNNRERALELYEWNLTLSAAFIVPLQVCEVAIRNGIAEGIEHVHGHNWPRNEGFLRSLPRPRRGYNPEQDLRQAAARQPTTGKIIADLKFVFWEHLFTVGQETRIWNRHFRTCFPGAPATLTIAQARTTAYNDLRNIRALRNRIAHHEPIFTRDLGDDYQKIHDMISWRSATAATWMDRTQGVLALIPQRP